MAKKNPTMEDVERLPHLYYSCIECAKVFFYCHGSRAKGPIPARACATCKRLPKYWVHGTATTYGKGCRCEPCRGANVAKQRKHAQGFKAKHGALPSQVHVSTWYTFVCENRECRVVTQSNRQSTRFCSRSCRTTVSNTERAGRSTELVLFSESFSSFQKSTKDLAQRQWITRRVRQSIYDRDQYVCHHCKAECNRTFQHGEPLSPTLDHAIPWSLGKTWRYINDPLNLLTCCAGCNLSRKTKWSSAEWLSFMVITEDVSVEDARSVRAAR